MKNKIRGYIYLCITLSISFFNRLFVSITHAQDTESTTSNSIPLAGDIVSPQPSPSEIVISMVRSILIVVIPITLIVLAIIFVQKKFFNKPKSKKKKKV